MTKAELSSLMQGGPMSRSPSRKPIALVAAMDRFRVIGRGNDIPWRIPGEQQRFKELTIGNALIMGRLTYESIRRPLPGRHIIVMSSSAPALAGSVPWASSVDAALQLAEQMPGDTIIIGGGQGIYELVLPIADSIYLTQIDADYGGDRHFPIFNAADFLSVKSEPMLGPTSFTYVTYQRLK